MALNCSLDILSEISIDHRRRIFGQQRDALCNGASRNGWRMNHRDGQCIALNNDFGAGRTRVRRPAKSLAASASEIRITRSAMARLYRHRPPDKANYV